MERPSRTTSHSKTVFILGGIAAVIAVLRYFMEGWLGPLGVPTAVGSLLASVTIVLLVGLIIIFVREGRANGRYVKAAAWFTVLAIWCEMLVISGILVTERTGAHTYYEGPWEAVHRMFGTPTAHAIGHTQGFVVRLAVWLILGAFVYWLAKRRRVNAIR
jgi:hypothetical protein